MFTCTRSVTVTQGDIDTGGLDGTVTVTASSPEGKEITASKRSVVPLAGKSLVALGKVAYMPEAFIYQLCLFLRR